MRKHSLRCYIAMNESKVSKSLGRPAFGNTPDPLPRVPILDIVEDFLEGCLYRLTSLVPSFYCETFQYPVAPSGNEMPIVRDAIMAGLRPSVSFR